MECLGVTPIPILFNGIAHMTSPSSPGLQLVTMIPTGNTFEGNNGSSTHMDKLFDKINP